MPDPSFQSSRLIAPGHSGTSVWSQAGLSKPAPYDTIERLGRRILLLTPGASLASLILSTDEKSYLERKLSQFQKDTEKLTKDTEKLTRVIKSDLTEAKMKHLQRALQESSSAAKNLETLLDAEQPASTRRLALINYLDIHVLVARRMWHKKELRMQDIESNNGIGVVSSAREGFADIRSLKTSEKDRDSSIRQTLLHTMAELDGLSDTITQELIAASGLKGADISSLRETAKGLSEHYALSEAVTKQYVKLKDAGFLNQTSNDDGTIEDGPGAPSGCSIQ